MLTRPLVEVMIDRRAADLGELSYLDASVWWGWGQGCAVREGVGWACAHDVIGRFGRDIGLICYTAVLMSFV